MSFRHLRIKCSNLKELDWRPKIKEKGSNMLANWMNANAKSHGRQIIQSPDNIYIECGEGFFENSPHVIFGMDRFIEVIEELGYVIVNPKELNKRVRFMKEKAMNQEMVSILNEE